jgi:epoxyqueuosine reductase QueG
MKRAKWAGLIRNACIALGNSAIQRESASGQRIIQVLENLANSENSTIKESALWALTRIQTKHDDPG